MNPSSKTSTLEHSERDWKAPAVGYFLLTSLFCLHLLLPSWSLYRWDTLLYNWPFQVDARAQILAGHLPFWSSAFCNGTPLLANVNAGVLYPPRLVCWFLPLRAGSHTFLFLHVWFSLLGMHFLLRRGFRIPTSGAVVGACAYALSGYARGMWDTYNFVALPWIPLGLAAFAGGTAHNQTMDADHWHGALPGHAGVGR